jgi:hypothetical protein
MEEGGEELRTEGGFDGFDACNDLIVCVPYSPSSPTIPLSPLACTAALPPAWTWHRRRDQYRRTRE